DRVRLFGGDSADRCERLADTAYRAGQEDRFAAYFARFTGNLDATKVDIADSSSQPVGCQANSVGGERVGLDDFGARGNVGAMDRLDEVTLAQVELVEAALVRHTLGIQLGAHAPVEQNGRARGKPIKECAAHGERNSVLGTRVALH